MRRPTHLTTLFSAAVVLTLCLAGCDDGADPASPSDDATPPVAPTEPVVAITTCDQLTEVLLCEVLWDHNGEPEWITLDFYDNGAMSWSVDDSRVEGTGTWTFDGDRTVSVHLDTPIPQVPTSDLSLEFGKTQNGCGTTALVDPALSLHFDPQACE